MVNVLKLLELVDRLCEDLAGYTESAVATALGPVGMAGIAREQRLPGICSVDRNPSRMALVAALFMLGGRLSLEEYEQVLPSIPLEEAIEAGLVTDSIRSCIAIRPVPVDDRHGGGELLIASDLGPLQGKAPSTDHVMPVGGATKTLASLTSFEAGQTVLDLGTGCGYHALLAAKAGAKVVATDVSERALAFTKLNASLAGLEVETRLGSLYEPAPERFDRIVSNPPFVITPAKVRAMIGTFEYRDGGVEGDSLLQEAVAGTKDHLTEDGIAWMLGNWQVAADVTSGSFGEAWKQPVEEWLGDQKAWVVLRDAIDPAQYAEMWLRESQLTGSAYDSAYCVWLGESAKDTSIAFGYLTIAAEDGPQRLEDYRGPIADTFVDSTWAGLELVGASDQELLAMRLVSKAVLETRLHTPGQPDPWHISITAHGREIPVSAEVAGFLGASDGELTAGQIIAALAQLLSVPEDEMTEAVLPAVRELIGAGALVLGG